MAKYEVLRDCYGFRNSLWEKGQIVEVEAGEKPPAYFSCLRHARESTNNQSKKRGSRRKLTEKQKNFIKAYLRRLCGTKAAVAAYPQVKNRNTAGVMAYELMRNPKIKKIIREQLDKNNCVYHFIDFEITE